MSHSWSLVKLRLQLYFYLFYWSLDLSEYFDSFRPLVNEI